jgi:RHS repeat-associated protein
MSPHAPSAQEPAAPTASASNGAAGQGGAAPFAVAAPALDLPRGGGAIRGIGEKFSANPATGTASLRVPIAASPGRGGIGPQLSLGYDSGAGNGPFGFGWSIDLPQISRRTDKGLPRYDDAAESDVFILAGAEDLVPVLDAAGARVEDRSSAPGHLIQRYRPRTEGAFVRIERWTRLSDGDVHWRSLSGDNLLSVYGQDAQSRIADPLQPARVFAWLLCERRDDRGNAMLVEYKPEDGAGAPLAAAHQRNRGAADDLRRGAERYPKRIRYGNRVPLLDAAGVRPPFLDAALRDAADWMFELVFDYGEHDAAVPLPAEAQHWLHRGDAFSRHRAGFELRTARLCRRTLMFHHFAQEPGIGRDCLVRSTEFAYDEGGGAAGHARLLSVSHCGWRRRDAGYLKRSLPPLEFGYSEAVLQSGVSEVDPAGLQPGTGLAGRSVQWTDLHGDGLPGLLHDQGGAWYYQRNLGPAGDGAAFAPAERVGTRPNLAGAQARWMDLAGDGQPDIVLLDGALAGFHEHDAAEGWGPFRPFVSRPNRDLADPQLRFIDLDGDGRADLLISEDEAFVWHASLAEQGFAPARRVRQALDEERGPRLVFADPAQSIYLADMDGDGLTDLVRIRDGEVCYWPNLGFGRFGAKVAMDDAPHFDRPDRFDQHRIRLADIDGSGTADLVYLGSEGVTLYFNRSGNGWSAGQRLAAFPAVDQLAAIQVLDLLGTGTACLVWSSPLPGQAARPMRYVDLMGGKPHLLTRIVNNLGAETLLHYAPSTRFFLADRLAGRPWITRLPFPVQVLERVETIDRISGNRFVTRHAYHHGHFDGVEREFRGFGMVEQWDTEEFAALAGASNVDAGSHVPPLLTRRWYHTGAWLGSAHTADPYAALGEYWREPGLDDDAAALRLPLVPLPAGLSLEEQRQACRALRGSLLREEVYALDGSAREPFPYTVREQSFAVRLLQPQGGQRHAVFLAHPREALSFQYERRPADPRIGHTLTLEVDDHGQVLRAATVAYGRRAPDVSLDASDQARQAQRHETGSENAFTCLVDEAFDYRLPLPAESRAYELRGIALPAGSARHEFVALRAAFAGAETIAFEAAFTPGRAQKRLIQHQRTRYRPNDLGASRGDVLALLPPGELESRALPGEAWQLVLTPGLVEQQFGARVDAALLEDAGRHVHSEGDAQWWQRSGRSFFSPGPADDAAAELAHALAHFFQPHRFRDAFHRPGFETEAVLAYDAHDLAVVETRDALGNATQAVHDYRVLQPRLLTDANGNRSEAAFDALGLVVGTAAMGKPGEALGDSLLGFERDLDEATLLAHLAEPLRDPHALLQRAGTRLVYDLFAYRRTSPLAQPQPAVVWTIAREVHDADLPAGAKSPLQHRLACSDGFGREIQAKAQAEPGPLAAGGPSVAPRWVGSGWTVYDNKGRPVRRYEPFFSAAHGFEFARAEGVSAVLCHDPLGRVVATLHPNHTWEKVVFDAWHQLSWDVNDTVLIADPAADADVGGFFRRLSADEWLPTWHQQRAGGALGPPEQAAAAKAAVHAATPGTVHLDPLGRSIVSIAHNRTQRGDMAQPEDALLVSRVVYDIQGRERDVIDALGRAVMRYDHDLLGQRLHSASMEAGERWMLADAAGRPLAGWDSRGHRLRTEHDVLGRAVGTHLQTDGGAEQLVTRTRYGEGEPEPERSNVRGRVVQVADGAGLLSTAAYDFKGNALAGSRRLCADHKSVPDWRGEPALEPEVFTTSTGFDALNRPVTQTTPDGSVTRRGYDRAGALRTLEANLRGETANGQPVWTAFVTGADYDARGQRLRIAYGNGAVTTHSYDPLTFRLTRLRTTAAGRRVQDLTYTYDPVGNISRIEDDAQQTIFFRNRRVEPSNDYLYDATYQLIEADGREHLGQLNGVPNAPTAPDAFNRFHSGLEHPGDGNAMGRYIERYVYDAAGNFLEMRHAGSDPSHPGWTRRYAYEEPSLLEAGKVSNRLSWTQVGQGPQERMSYDAHGSMTTMAHLPVMRWDYLDRLVASAQQVVGEGGVPETTCHVYDAGGARTLKVTESAVPAGGTPARLRQRIRLGCFEVEREFDPSGSVVEVERTTLSIHLEAQRLALVETTLQGQGSGSSAALLRFQFGGHLGSSALELDAAARVISYEEYLPFGSTSYQAIDAALAAAAKRYRHAGLERDDESGLVLAGARFLAPWIGRWTTADPGGLIDGSNLYAYARNSPTMRIDPGGRESFNAGEPLLDQLHDELGNEFVMMRATKGTWISATTKALGLDEVYTKEQGYGAYVPGVVLNDQGLPFENTDKLDVGEIYYVRVASAPPAEASAPAAPAGPGQSWGKTLLRNAIDFVIWDKAVFEGQLEGGGSAQAYVGGGLSAGVGLSGTLIMNPNSPDFMKVAVNPFGLIEPMVSGGPEIGGGPAGGVGFTAGLAEHFGDSRKATLDTNAGNQWGGFVGAEGNAAVVRGDVTAGASISGDTFDTYLSDIVTSDTWQQAYDAATSVDKIRDVWGEIGIGGALAGEAGGGVAVIGGGSYKLAYDPVFEADLLPEVARALHKQYYNWIHSGR